jgi:hypothetical protein
VLSGGFDRGAFLILEIVAPFSEMGTVNESTFDRFDTLREDFFEEDVEMLTRGFLEQPAL